MHRPAPLDVPVAPSRIVCAWIIALAAMTLAIVLTLPIAWWARALIAIPICGWAVWRWRGFRAGGTHALRRLQLDGDLRLLLTYASGRTLRGSVRPATYVGPRVNALVWRPAGRSWSRAQCIAHDMLCADDFRRLRVLLRYGRSESTQGDP